jgi:cellulose synthase operon protein C
LKRIRGRVADLFDLSIQTDMFLGLCYEKLGSWELARNHYNSVLQQQAENAPALAGVNRVNEKIGLPDSVVSDTSEKEVDPGVDLQQLINAELQKPDNEQKWGPINDGLKKLAADRGLEEAHLKLMLAEIALKRERFDEARKLLQEADELSPHNLQISMMAVEVLRADPKHGPATALKMLDRFVKEFDDPPKLRLQRAQLLLQLNLEPEELKTQLATLAVVADAWTDDQKVELWRGLASVYLSLNMREEARRYLTLAADHQPNDLPTRLTLFALALEAKDDEAMKAAQDKILEVVRNKDNSNWLYTEARRRLSLVERGQLERDALDEIRILIDRALTQRPDWNDLYLLSADVELIDRNAALALKHFEAAAARGRGNPAANAKHIKLV